MKAIVANVLFGGILGCLSCANSTQASPLAKQSIPDRSTVPRRSTRHVFTSSIPLTQLPQSSVTAIPLVTNSIDRALTINGLQSLNSVPERGYHQWLEQHTIYNFDPQPQIDYFPTSATDCWTDYCSSLEPNIDRLFIAPKQTYRHRSKEADIVLGFQKTFWSNENKGKYWGITTVKHWGNDTKKSHSPQPNYINSAPILASGSSTLTLSGGGNQNLIQLENLDRNANVSQEFEDFRGGITYHHGVAEQLTMGVGFVYEDIFTGFTQLTYRSDILPIKTTLSVLAKESATDFHSHIQFKPAPNFVANYYGDYGDAEAHKFDADWGIYPGLNLIAKANSKQESYSTGVKVAFRNNYFSVTATAALDHQQNLQWKLNSQIGQFKFVHSSDRDKSNSELSNELLNSTKLGLQCSAFVKYQTRQTKKAQQGFTVLGGKIHSQAKVGDRHQWQFSVGYGTSDHGTGWIADGAVALQPDLLLKLNYQEISAVSDETEIKLQLSSK